MNNELIRTAKSPFPNAIWRFARQLVSCMLLGIVYSQHNWNAAVEQQSEVEPQRALLKMDYIRPEIVKLPHQPSVQPNVPERLPVTRARKGPKYYPLVKMLKEWISHTFRQQQHN